MSNTLYLAELKCPHCGSKAVKGYGRRFFHFWVRGTYTCTSCWVSFRAVMRWGGAW